MTPDPDAESWVVNASPLILLGRIGQLGLLGTLAAGIRMLAAVIEKLAAGADFDPEGGPTLSWARASRRSWRIAWPERTARYSTTAKRALRPASMACG